MALTVNCISVTTSYVPCSKTPASIECWTTRIGLRQQGCIRRSEITPNSQQITRLPSHPTRDLGSRLPPSSRGRLRAYPGNTSRSTFGPALNGPAYGCKRCPEREEGPFLPLTHLPAASLTSVLVKIVYRHVMSVGYTMVHLEKRRFDVVNQKQVILLVIPPIVLALATLVVAVRWHARKTKRINTLVEDVLCLCGLVRIMILRLQDPILILADYESSCCHYCFCFSPRRWSRDDYAGSEGQVWKTSWYQILAEGTTCKRMLKRMLANRLLKTQFAVDICWATSVTAVHLSLLQFYARLYDTRHKLRILCYGMMGCVTAWYVYAIIAWAYHCHPPGGCALASKGNCITIGSIHVAFNAIVMSIAIPAVYDMHLSKKKKLSISGLFLLGSLYVLFFTYTTGIASLTIRSCTICAVLRMDCVFPFFADIQTDPIGAAWGRMLFSPLEIAVGIIAASIPTLTPFHARWRDERRHLPKEGTGLRRLKIRSSSSGSSTSNLNPAHWVGKAQGQVNAFVSLEDGGKSNERVRDLGPHDIKVTKEYNIGQREVTVTHEVSREVSRN